MLTAEDKLGTDEFLLPPDVAGGPVRCDGRGGEAGGTGREDLVRAEHGGIRRRTSAIWRERRCSSGGGGLGRRRQGGSSDAGWGGAMRFR